VGQKIDEKLAFSAQTTASFAKTYHNIGFGEKRQFFFAEYWRRS
jgi:hypothetical protein